VTAGKGSSAAWRVSALVWVVWATMLLVVLACIAKYGPDIPRAEDWLLVPPLTGNEPSLIKWLWEQNSEHRLPLPRLAYLGLLKLTGGDFRSGMVFDTLLMAALAGAMILVARRLRGRSSYADAFFPIAFLNLGHWDNLIWSWQIQFVLSIFFASVLLLIIVTQGTELAPGPAAIAGGCLVALPLCGANGLVLGPGLAAWLGYAALRAWRGGQPEGRTTAIVLSASVGIALVLTGLYFVGYERATWPPPSPSVGATLQTGAQFLAMAFGPGAAASWRASVAITFAALFATLALLVVQAWGGDDRERRRALGLLCFVAAMLTLALAIGWGRAGRVPTTARLSRRYALLAVPFLCAVYFAWELYGRRRWATFVQTGLLVVACVLVPSNTLRGLEARDWVRAGMDAVRRDIATGMPRSLLAERHGPFLLHWDGQRLAAGMRMLGEAGFEPFVGLRDEFTIQEVMVPAAPAGGNAGQDGVPSVTFERPQRVYAIRLPASQRTGGSTARGVRFAWEGRERGAVRGAVPTPVDGAQDETVWVNDVIDGFRVEADDLDGLRGVRFVVLVPPRQ